MNGDAGMVFFFILAGGLYMLPSLIALLRDHPLLLPLAVINLLLGWTFAVYVGCLVVAVWPLRGR